MRSVVDALHYRWIIAVERIVNGILKAQTAVPISRAIKARKHEHSYSIMTTNLRNHFTLQSVEDALKNWSYYGSDGSHFVSDRVFLELKS